MRRVAFAIALLGLFSLPVSLRAGDFDADPGMGQFIDEMVREHGFSRDHLERVFSEAAYKQAIIDAISRPAEKVLTWKEYQAIFLTEARISAGREFIARHREQLERAEEVYGVPAEIVAAVIGVETFYGNRMGSYRVIDALSTLAFQYPPRSKFFRSQLKEFLLLVREENRDELEFSGSYAGAMGLGQFIPSSYRSFAIDFDGDGRRDIWQSPADAIGSVANYLGKHGWRRGQGIAEAVSPPARYREWFGTELKPRMPVAEMTKAGIRLAGGAENDLLTPLLFQGTQGEEYWVGYYNFYVITRYNHSGLYAMAVFELSRSLAS